MMKVKYIYESHLSGFFVSNKKLTYDELYCEECGDRDWLLCEATKPQDIWDALESEIDIDGSGGYDKEYVENFIKGIEWNK